MRFDLFEDAQAEFERATTMVAPSLPRTSQLDDRNEADRPQSRVARRPDERYVVSVVVERGDQTESKKLTRREVDLLLKLGLLS